MIVFYFVSGGKRLLGCMDVTSGWHVGTCCCGSDCVWIVPGTIVD